MRRVAFLLPAVLLAGCVGIPGAVDEDHLSNSQIMTGEAFQDLDSGFNEQQSLHFLVRAYGLGKASQIAWSSLTLVFWSVARTSSVVPTAIAGICRTPCLERTAYRCSGLSFCQVSVDSRPPSPCP